MSTQAEVPPFAVQRPALVQRLQEAAEQPLTCIFAPPGFGKSMLLQQWSVDRDDVGWVQLDARDNDGRRLAGRLLEALTRIDEGIGTAAFERADLSGASLGDSFIAQVLEQIEVADPGVLVIEGVDTLTNDRLLLDLRALIHHVSPNLRVVVAARFAPDRSWASGPFNSIDRVDLAFDGAQAAELLTALSHRELSESQVDRVMAKTEGWPAGLHLTALALRDGADADALIDALSGADQFIGAYLAEEVLARQSPAMRNFLLKTSVLRRLNAPLVEATTGEQNGRELLDVAHRRAMFVVPVEDDPTWYRYHTLFRDLTRQELRSRMPAAEPDLLRAAARWHLEHGDLEAGAAYLIEVEDWEGILTLVEASAKELFERGAASVVLAWLDQVPSALRAGRVETRLIEAILRTMVGATVQAEQIIEELVDAELLAPGEVVIADTLRALWVMNHAPPATAIVAADAALAALATLPEGAVPDLLGLLSRTSIREICMASRARALWFQGDVVRARVEWLELLGSRFEYEPWRVSALGGLALLHTWSGCLHDGHDAAARALVEASRGELVDHPSAGDAHVAMATILRERGHLGRAELLLEQALGPIARVQRWVMLGVHVAERAALDLARGDAPRGLDRLATFARQGHPSTPPFIEARMRAVEGQLHLAVGDVSAAARVAEAAGPWTTQLRALTVQIAIRTDDRASARTLLDTWPLDESRDVLLQLLWRAILHDAEGEPARAQLLMSEAVALAEPEGHVRLFHEAGPGALRLLRGLSAKSPTRYLSRVLEHETAAVSDDSPEGALSARELVVLRYLPSRLSNAELAAQLYVSQNTVKSHLRSIYRRLGVSNRRDAIAEAERRGLL